MTTARIYLAAPLELRGYRALLERLRLLKAGIQALHKGVEVLFPHGRTPGEDPVTGARPTERDLRVVGERMIEGDGALHPGATEVWGLGDGDHDQLALGAELGLPCRGLDLDEQEQLEEAGRAVLDERRSALFAEVVPDRSEPRCKELETPHDVLHAYFREAELRLGVRGLPLVRVGGSNPCRQRDMQLELGVRVALAKGYLRRAQADRRWLPGTMEVLRVMEIEKGTALQAAEAAGRVPDETTTPESLERWARRRRRRGLGVLSGQIERYNSHAENS